MGFYATAKVGGVEVTARFPWKVGIVVFMAFPETAKEEGVKEAIATLVRDEFFDELEFQVYREAVWKEIEPILKERELLLGAALQLDILTMKLSLNSSNEAERRKTVDHVKRRIEEAAERGITTVALCSGPDPEPERRAEETRLLVNSLKELCEHAKRYGSRIILEAFDREHDKKLLIGPISEAAEIVREVRKEYNNIGLLWDLSHAPMLGESPEVLKDYKDVLYEVHVGCAKKADSGFKDTHPTFYTPGSVNGVEEVARLFKVLLDINYKGVVTLEIKPEPTQTSLGIINNAKGVFLSAFAKVLKEVV